MKVVMTVDIPIEDYTAISELDFHANINIFPGVTTTMHHYSFENVVVRPLPEKVKVKKIEDIMHAELQIMDEIENRLIAKIKLETDKLFALGYNAYHDEITGENE